MTGMAAREREGSSIERVACGDVPYSPTCAQVSEEEYVEEQIARVH